MEKDYKFELYTDYSSGVKEFVARFIDFDHIIGVGATIKEAIKEAHENLNVYIEFCQNNKIDIQQPSR